MATLPWCLAALCISVAGHAADSLPPERFADPARRAAIERVLPRIDALMAQAHQDLSLPALAYAVVVDGDVVRAGAYGWRDVAAKAPADADTAFRIASMTKSFTALAVLKLRDAGRLGLDDPVSRHVPELRAWLPASGDAGPITLRHLLAHTAGLPEDNPQGDRQLALSAPAFGAWIRGPLPLARAPGRAFEYSNLGFMLLGRVISNISGRPFQIYIRDEILRPLGMHDTHWSAAAVPPARLALGYARAGEGWQPEPLLDDGEGAAMGGLITSARDLGRYVAAMLQAWPPRDAPEAPPALRRTLREMQSGQGWPQLWVERRWAGAAPVIQASSYGFGLMASVDCRWGREVEHAGGLPGFGSKMLWLPDHGVGVLVMGNLTYAGVGRPAYGALRLLHEAGALQPRQAQPAPALQHAAGAAEQLVTGWSDERAEALAADNLFLDEPLAARRSAVGALREGLGACRPGVLKAENALRGNVRVECEHGWLDIELTLAPVPEPRVQHLHVSAGRPPQPALAAGIDDVAAAMGLGVQRLNLAPAADRAAVAAVLETARGAFGHCRPGAVLEGDGVDTARVQLLCERGRPEMQLTLAQGRLLRLAVRPPAGEVCLP